MWDRRKDGDGGAFNVFRILPVSTRATPSKQLVVYINNKTFMFGFSNEKIIIYVWNYIFLTYMLYFILIT